MPTPNTPPGMPIRFRGLTKTFGPVRAVDGVDLDVLPGRVTGLLGPNGSGKTTMLRMLLGLVRPDAGSAMIGDRPYVSIPRPGTVVGASLEASFHPGRKAVDHLLTLAPAIGASRARVDEVLGLVGLSDAAGRRVGGFSLGMRQRLGLAGTLLGDPGVLVLDEPANGLDPQGILWLRDLLRHLAREGRTVLVSSHILAEVQATVDDVAVLSRGSLVHASSLAEMVHLADSHVRVAGPDMEALARLVTERGWVLEDVAGGWVVRGAKAPEVGAAAFAAGLELHALESVGANLEETFLRIVSGEVPGSVRALEDGRDAAGAAA
ncbi:ATP-binding cassette domain-containing protein [Nocardioides gilvus]|uniref:ATP-binding cassette domain-containing protein n=1 Tax=Nocardioides gilvus TaxID=1735589 RepID=UPI001EF4D6DE|nr:ATP-binding cassette domain-containing protein [Nocardioides gilvus]